MAFDDGVGASSPTEMKRVDRAQDRLVVNGSQDRHET